jgi:hypothetical protein
MTGNKLLVGRHHRLACREGAAHQIFRGVEAADQLNHDLDIRIDDLPEVVGPNYVARYPGLLFSLEVAVADVCEAKQPVGALAQNFCDIAAYGSKADEGNPVCRAAAGACRCGLWSFM